MSNITLKLPPGIRRVIERHARFMARRDGVRVPLINAAVDLIARGREALKAEQAKEGGE